MTIKKYFILFVLAFLSLGATAQTETASFRIVSMNMKEGGKYADYKAKPYIDFIAKYNPDVVVMQEMDNFTNRNGKKDLLSEIAAGLGMFPYYIKSMSYQGGGFGLAILTKYPYFKAQKTISYPNGVNEPRACGWVYLQLPDGHIIRFVTVHLAVESEDYRVKNIAEYNLALFKDNTTPTIIAGDFNATPGSTSLMYVQNKWQNICGTDGFTIPSSEPNRRLDYIMGSPKNNWSCSHFEIVPEPGLSDHCFLVADITYQYR